MGEPLSTWQLNLSYACTDFSFLYFVSQCIVHSAPEAFFKIDEQTENL